MYILRPVPESDKLFDHLKGHLLFSIFPEETVLRCYDQSPSPIKRRIRHFTPQLVFLLILMSTLWPRESLQRVWKVIARAFCNARVGGDIPTVSRKALTYQRAHFDSEILHRVMQACCQPLCHGQRTPSAFYHHKRLMAIDGTRFNVPDTQANAEAFGRPANQHGEGPLPQVQGVALMECGSRGVLDVSLGRHSRAENHALPALLPRLTSDMLILMDSAFFSGWFWGQVHHKIGADLLGAISSTVALKVEKRLSDGSYVTTIRPRRGIPPLTIRVIEYFIHDERIGPEGQCYRLATTLLDADRYPALELIALYHERWEEETMYDETKTHQREQVRVLRSRTPAGVRQEVYALFLAHYAISTLRSHAAEERGLDPDRISFTTSRFELKDSICESLRLEPGDSQHLIIRVHQRITEELLPERRLRINRREVKMIYSKYKQKKRGVPPLAKFRPEEQFLEYVTVWERPDGVRPIGKQRGRKRSIVSQIGQETEA